MGGISNTRCKGYCWEIDSKHDQSYCESSTFLTFAWRYRISHSKRWSIRLRLVTHNPLQLLWRVWSWVLVACWRWAFAVLCPDWSCDQMLPCRWMMAKIPSSSTKFSNLCPRVGVTMCTFSILRYQWTNNAYAYAIYHRFNDIFRLNYGWFV